MYYIEYMCILMYLATAYYAGSSAQRNRPQWKRLQKKNIPRRNIIFPKQAFIY